MLLGDMVCITLNRDHRNQRKELSQEIGKKIIDNHVKHKGYKTISKQITVSLFKKCKIHWTVEDQGGHHC